MDKFLETYNLPRVNREGTDNLNTPITKSEIEFEIKKKKKTTKNLPTNKSPGPDGFTRKFYQTYQEKLGPILLQLFQKTEENRTLSFILPGHHYSYIKIRQRHYKKRILEANIFDEYRHKNLQQNINKPIEQYFKRIIHNDQAKFIKRTQGWFNICKSISVVHHINKSNDKNHMIISTDARKAYDKTQHPFMIQTFIKVSTEETSLILMKAIYDKPTANIIFIVESLSSKFRNKTGCPLLPLLFNIVL